ncbi:hypothetical protein DFH06DRAFT_1426664, partial [Mycena polygramma]
MVRLPTPSTLEIAWVGLLVSIGLNLSAIYVFRHRPDLDTWKCTNPTLSGYRGDDYPYQLPLHLPLIALKIEESKSYRLSDFDSYNDWRSTDVFPTGNGFVKLGPDGGASGIAMFHQMHCLQRVRDAILDPEGSADQHAAHCLNLLRQTVLCASDTSLDALNMEGGTDGIGTVHVCRDWQKVYDFVEENQ